MRATRGQRTARSQRTARGQSVPPTPRVADPKAAISPRPDSRRVPGDAKTAERWPTRTLSCVPTWVDPKAGTGPTARVPAAELAAHTLRDPRKTHRRSPTRTMAAVAPRTRSDVGSGD